MALDDSAVARRETGEAILAMEPIDLAEWDALETEILEARVLSSIAPEA